MSRQLGYKQEVKPSAVLLILKIVLLVIYLILGFLFFLNDKTFNYFMNAFSVIILTAIPFFFYRQYKTDRGTAASPSVYQRKIKEYEDAIRARNLILSEGKRYNGHVIGTETKEHIEERHYFGARKKVEVIVKDFCAVVEYTDEQGVKVQFTTPELTGNPKYLLNNEVTVFVMQSVHYATNFGKFDIPNIKFSFTMDKQ